MVDGILFDKLAAIAKALKKNNLPFGGIQLVVTGDFFQLPPVTKSAQPVFAFEVKAWSQVIHHTVNLTQVFRQKDTSKFSLPILFTQSMIFDCCFTEALLYLT